MLISVVIPTFNQNELLAKCLDSLAPDKQSLNKNDYEVIVTDDSLQDVAKELVTENYPWAKWVAGPKKGRSANRNNGAKYALGEWIVFIDGDEVADKDILLNYSKAYIEHPDAKAFEGAIHPESWEALKKDMAVCGVNTTGGYFWSGNICIEKKMFFELGGFDEAFVNYGHEDQDIYEQLKKATTIPFVKNSVVFHPVNIISLKKRIKKIPFEVRNWFKYEQKNNKQTFKRMLIVFGRLFIDYSKQSIRELFSLKIKSFVYSFSFLLVGIPQYFLCYFKKEVWPQ